MKFFVIFIGLSLSSAAFAKLPPANITEVKIPYMERPGLHRVYADALLNLALKASEEVYGPYKVIQQSDERVINRQLLDISSGQLSVAVAMPNAEWLAKATPVKFPIMKGFASYRLFFITEKNKAAINKVKDLEDLKAFKVGQGRGWSTADILEHYQFDVVYAPNYTSLFPMLEDNRYQLLMRGVYEMEVELFANKIKMPDLAIADNIAVYTYLPMYYFVAKTQPELAERLEYGLKKLYTSGEFDKLFKEHFWSSLKLLDLENRKVFYLQNNNIDPTFFANDKPYLLNHIHM